MKLIKLISSALLASSVLALLSSSKSIPKNAIAVKPFDQKRYLGKWYEIARFDYKWEKNLDNVTATYTLREDGKIRVDNKGRNTKKNKWEQSIGKAKPASETNEGKLKVSFFGPFYAGYNVIAIDEDYKYSLVVGDNTKYLWILSREKTIPESVKEEYLKLAKSIGCKTDELIWVKQDLTE